MIVDVLRNDLGRVCVPGTVRVPRLCRLERTAAVQHLVSTVTGRLAPGRDAFDLLAASFPGGSITGAPKIRAMELLEELEPVRRGPYTGALGWIGPDGAMATSILIRTFVADGTRLTLHVGGGITWRSDPAAEWDETVAKARGPLSAIGGREVGSERPASDATARATSGSTAGSAADGAAPVRVRPRLPARRRRLRDAPRPRRPPDRARRARRAPPALGGRPGDPARPTTSGRPGRGDRRAARRRRASAARTATPASGSRSPAASFLGRGLLPPDEHPAPTIVVQAWPVPPTPAAHLEQGLHLVASRVRRDPENPLSALKTTSRADYVYARVEARTAGADDALFLTIDGFLSEATSANLFLVRGAALATPSLGCAILPGTTRDWILRWAGGGRAFGRTRPGSRPRDLAEADEAFLSSSVAGILPVTRFEGEPIGDGRPGDVDAARPRRPRGVHRSRRGRRRGGA